MAHPLLPVKGLTWGKSHTLAKAMEKGCENLWASHIHRIPIAYASDLKIALTLREKNKAEGVSLPDFRQCYHKQNNVCWYKN